MLATATLTVHRGATRVTRDALARYEPPEAEGQWRPVKHSLIVDLMHEELSRREMQITPEEYAIQREGNYLFAALTTTWLNTGRRHPRAAMQHRRPESRTPLLGGRAEEAVRDFLSAVAADPDAHSRDRQLSFQREPHRLGAPQRPHLARQESPSKRQYPGTRPVRPLFRAWQDQPSCLLESSGV